MRCKYFIYCLLFMKSLFNCYKVNSVISPVQYSRSLLKSSLINKNGLFMVTQIFQNIETKFNSSAATTFFKPKVLFVLGGPGAGKGTQCEMLSNEFSMVHLSAGELLRIERLSGNENGRLIDSYLKDGKIVPVKITLDLLKRAMYNSKCNRFLIDGFPRNWDNIQGWEENMENSCDVDGVLFIDCAEDVLQDRILNRGLTSGRTDDNIATVKKRFLTFHDSTLPILKHYENDNKLIRISGDRSKNDVFDDIKPIVSQFIGQDLAKLQNYLLYLLHTKNWSEYVNYCSPSIITSVDGNMGSPATAYDGLDVHKVKYFDNHVKQYVSASLKVSDFKVKVSGRNAVSSNDVDVIGHSLEPHTFRETRHWEIIDDNWKLVKYSSN